MAISIMLAHAVIPHHEHGDVICFETIHHCDDTACGDSHEHSATDCSPCCFDKQDVIRTYDELNFTHCGQGTACDYHFPPILLFLGCFFDLFETPLIIVQKPYLNLYTSAEFSSANSLRGPPQI